MRGNHHYIGLLFMVFWENIWNIRSLKLYSRLRRKREHCRKKTVSISDHEQVAKLLIEHCASLNLKDKVYEKTALHWAAENGNL